MILTKHGWFLTTTFEQNHKWNLDVITNSWPLRTQTFSFVELFVVSTCFYMSNVFLFTLKQFRRYVATKIPSIPLNELMATHCTTLEELNLTSQIIQVLSKMLVSQLVKPVRRIFFPMPNDGG